MNENNGKDFDELLPEKTDQPDPRRKAVKKILHAVSSILFMLGLICFFVVGAIFNNWSSAWISILIGIGLSLIVESVGDLLLKKNVIAAVDGLIMLLAIIAFFVIGFTTDKWHPAWVVFPVGALLCGILSILKNTFKR